MSAAHRGVAPGPAIELTGVGKRYHQLEEQAMLLKSLLPFWRPTRTERWALRDIDLRIEPGETVGVLGHNGAGKTSLLRLLAGVSEPSAGRVAIRGRVAPLISVGVGFHQEMSGRENVYVNGMLLGLTKREVDERYDEIVAFAQLEEFIDTPVKFYSSGMFMRLGFSVAVHVDPQVFLVDEVLAVGDLMFQLKCFDKMRELKATGTTIVLVSHSLHAIRLLCPRAILLQRGRLEADGPVEDVIARHHQLLSQDGGLGGGPGTLDLATGSASVMDRQLVGPDGPTAHLPPGVPAVLRARVRFDTPVEDPLVHFTVLAEDGTVVYEMRSAAQPRHRRFDAGDEAEVEIAFTPQMGGGSFRLLLTVASFEGQALHRDSTGLLVYVPPPLGAGGVAHLDATISLDGEVINDHPDVRL